MQNNVKQLECMICSSLDEATNSLRNDCENIINHWNKINSKARGITFLTTGLNLSTVADSGADAQKLIDEQALDSSDFGPIIFETPNGSEYHGFHTGTEYEIDRLLKQGKKVYVHVRNSPDLSEVRQRLQKTKAILYQEYKSRAEFLTHIRDCLDYHANNGLSLIETPLSDNKQFYMVLDKNSEVYDFIKNNPNTSRNKIIEELGFSSRIIDKALHNLIFADFVQKQGAGKNITYSISEFQNSSHLV